MKGIIYCQVSFLYLLISSAASHRPSRAAEGAGVPRPAEAWSCGRVVAERTGLAVTVSPRILGGSPRSTRISERSRERRNPSGGREVRSCGIHQVEAEVLARNGGEDRGGHPWWRRRKGCSLARGGVGEENRCAMHRKLTGKGSAPGQMTRGFLPRGKQQDAGCNPVSSGLPKGAAD